MRRNLPSVLQKSDFTDLKERGALFIQQYYKEWCQLTQASVKVTMCFPDLFLVHNQLENFMTGVGGNSIKEESWCQSLDAKAFENKLDFSNMNFKPVIDIYEFCCRMKDIKTKQQGTGWLKPLSNITFENLYLSVTESNANWAKINQTLIEGILRESEQTLFPSQTETTFRRNMGSAERYGAPYLVSLDTLCYKDLMGPSQWWTECLRLILGCDD